MTCICEWPVRCNGFGVVKCHADSWGDCYCACGCEEECSGCRECIERSDEDE